MFREVFRFELSYQLQRPWTWLFFIVLVVLNFLMTRDATLSEALFEEFFVNSPFAIAKTTVFGNLIWLVMAAIVAGEAAARDVYTRMSPLLYTTSVGRMQYLGGKFIAALVLNALLLLAVQAGIMLAIYSPGVNPTLLSPFRLAAYGNAYLFIALPTAFVATAIQFAVALATGRPMASYAGSVLLVFMGFFVASILLFRQGLGTLLDPIGIRFIVEDTSHMWTTVEKNVRLIRFEGIVKENRLFWIAIGAVFLLISYFRFKFRHRVPKSLNFTSRFLSPLKLFKSKVDNQNQINDLTQEQIVFLEAKPTFGVFTQVRQALTLAWSSFKFLAVSWAGLALLFFIPLITFPVVIDQMQTHSGELVPTTIRVIRELTAPLSAELSRWVIIPGFIILFAGELIWREREARMGEITDAIYGSAWARLIGKFAGLTLVLIVFTALQMTAGMLAQVMLGYSNLEPELYLTILFGLQLPEYLLFAILALVVHVIVDQKYIAHMVAVLIYVFIALSSLFGIEHNMLVFGASPEWSYTDMRGFGNSIEAWLWFKFYWVAWAVLLAVVAKLVWPRGVHKTLRLRLRIARHNLTRSTLTAASVAIILIMTTGGFIFYNTNILHEYLTNSETKSRQAEYEKLLGRYRNAAQPSVTNANLNIEIYPNRGEVKIKGSYRLVNSTNVTIDSIHVTSVQEVDTKVELDRPISSMIPHKKFGHTIYVLESPLHPGESVMLNFTIQSTSKGFRESGANGSVVSNGTYFMNSWLPSIGYRSGRELITASDRGEFGLTPRPVIASLYDTASWKQRDEGTVLETVIGTDGDQIAVAPGKFVTSWKENNRNYFEYATDGPIGNEWSFFSARYDVREETWTSGDSTQQDVAIRIFHMPEHTAHLDRMVASIKASLDYYTKNFGPYRYNHLTVAEGPGLGNGLHAEASMLTHSEGFSLWNPDNDELGFDFPFAVVAHEMAHQWTVPYAAVEGAPVMSESVAWYYAMKQVEHAKGRKHLRKLLSEMRQPSPYPPIRRGEPLLRGLDPYLSYRRGPFALYTLSEYVGDKQINKALRNLLEHHRSPGAPLATTLDLHQRLKQVTPDSVKYLLHDLFEVNTYWHLKAQRATLKKTSSNTWEVVLVIETRKLVADSAGVETEVNMDEWLEVGAFTSGTHEPVYLQKHRIYSGKQKLVFELSKEPVRVAIDPNHLMIDLNPEDNFREVRE